MQLSGAPSKIVEPFGVNAGAGFIRTVPVPSQIGINPGAASYNDGFVPLNATAVTAGGIPPSIKDMNGILNEATAVDNWMSAGASFPYDSVYSAAIGGYPKGARLLNAAGTGFWFSLTDNNVTDPDTGGAGWIPDRAYASVYASAQQTLGTGFNKILWDTVEFDAFGLWNAGSKVFQAVWAGKYRISGLVYLPAPAGQNIGTGIFKNGTIARQCAIYPQVSDGAMAYAFDSIIPCAATDQLDARLGSLAIAVLAGQAGSNQAYVYGQLEYLGV